MARNPKIRVNYNSDAQYLLRLAHAVELDRKRPREWRKDMASRLTTLATEFLNAPEQENSETDKIH